jgi:hypothetical protein
LVSWLTDMELGTDRTHPRNSISGKMLGEHLGGLFLEQISLVLTSDRSLSVPENLVGSG